MAIDASIPLRALTQTGPPVEGPLDQYTKGLNLSNSLQQGQIQRLQIQGEQQSLAASKAAQQFGLIGSAAESVAGLPPEKRQSAWQMRMAILQSNGINVGSFPTQVPDDDGLNSLRTLALSQKDQIELKMKQDEQNKPVAVAPGASLVSPKTGKPIFEAPHTPISVAPGASLVNPASGEPVFTAPKTTKYEPKEVTINGKPALVGFDSEANKYFDSNGQDVTKFVQPKAEKSSNDDLDKYLAVAEQVKGGPLSAKEQQATIEHFKTLVPTASFNMNQGTRNDARLDKSYALNNGELDKAEKPIADAVGRFSRLQDTMNQMTPQADALIAPELLSVMAGGQGSGLRMNEAEISRLVGGRSNWESLKASLNKWQLDPTKALSVTDSQRQQMRGLMQAVYGKLQQKQQILDDARQQLINADNVDAHRQVIADVKKKLTAIDSAGGTSGFAVTDPHGVVHTFPSQAAADAFKKAAGLP